MKRFQILVFVFIFTAVHCRGSLCQDGLNGQGAGDDSFKPGLTVNIENGVACLGLALSSNPVHASISALARKNDEVVPQRPGSSRSQMGGAGAGMAEKLARTASEALAENTSPGNVSSDPMQSALPIGMFGVFMAGVVVFRLTTA